MHHTATTWSEFKERWDGVRNFLMEGECVPFSFEFPPIDQVVDELRRHPEANIHPGVKGSVMDQSSIAETFRALPLEEAMRSQFSIAHYHLSPFDVPGGFLHGFKERVLDKWKEALAAQGFTWTRCYPIIFISGADCATNYHMDYSHVVAWQIYGSKLFTGLLDPDRWAPHEVRMGHIGSLTMPSEIMPSDTLSYDMPPGTVLWNTILTPHWVEASAEVAMSVNLSHGGLRLDGKLCPFEQELMDWRAVHPEKATGLPQGVY